MKKCDCANCPTEPQKNGTHFFKPERKGKFYFISCVRKDCRKGKMKAMVRVVDEQYTTQCEPIPTPPTRSPNATTEATPPPPAGGGLGIHPSRDMVRCGLWYASSCAECFICGGECYKSGNTCKKK